MRGKGILIGDDFDLVIEPVRGSNGKIVGGLKVGNTLYQNQALILKCQPGELKETPMLGVGIDNISLDAGKAVWERKIRMQLGMDGQKVKSVKLGKKSLEIDATY